MNGDICFFCCLCTSRPCDLRLLTVYFDGGLSNINARPSVWGTSIIWHVTVIRCSFNYLPVFCLACVLPFEVPVISFIINLAERKCHGSRFLGTKTSLDSCFRTYSLCWDWVKLHHWFPHRLFCHVFFLHASQVLESTRLQSPFTPHQSKPESKQLLLFRLLLHLAEIHVFQRLMSIHFHSVVGYG